MKNANCCFWKQWYTPEDANDAANVVINSQKGFIYIFIHSFLYYPFSEINRLWHDNQSVDDFLLLTSFPQRRISEMESTLEAEGNWNQLPKSSFGIESVRIILSHIK